MTLNDMGLTEEEQKILEHDIVSKTIEIVYRRGFHHGYDCGLGCPNILEEIVEWRNIGFKDLTLDPRPDWSKISKSKQQEE